MLDLGVEGCDQMQRIRIMPFCQVRLAGMPVKLPQEQAGLDPGWQIAKAVRQAES
jgi:hypothetical protein